MGYILPHKFFQAQYGQALRQLIAAGKHLAGIVHFGDQQVFAGATTYTCLLFLDKAARDSFRFVEAHDLDSWRLRGEGAEGEVSAERATGKEWNFVVRSGAALFERLGEMPSRLGTAARRIFQGLKTGADSVYIVDELERESSRTRVFSRARKADYWIECDVLHPLVKGGDSRAYHLSLTKRLILFPYALRPDGTAALIPESAFRASYPLAWLYLTDNRKYLEEREGGKMRGAGWFGYTRNQALDVMQESKVFTPDIAQRASFSLDGTGNVFFSGGVAGGYGILVSDQYQRSYILGLLNSRLLDWYLHQSTTQMRGGYYSYEARFIRNLPIRTIDFSNPADAARHDQMVALVERMLDLHKKLAAAAIPADKELYKRQIEATDKQIDALVYELYGLTKDEIAIVEGASMPDGTKHE